MSRQRPAQSSTSCLLPSASCSCPSKSCLRPAYYSCLPVGYSRLRPSKRAYAHPCHSYPHPVFLAQCACVLRILSSLRPIHYCLPSTIVFSVDNGSINRPSMSIHLPSMPTYSFLPNHNLLLPLFVFVRLHFSTLHTTISVVPPSPVFAFSSPAPSFLCCSHVTS